MQNHHVDLQTTLFCGQCFGWKNEEGVFRSVIDKKLVSLTQENFSASVQEHAFLAHYFDMDWEYEQANEFLCTIDPHLKQAIEMFPGLHILNQDPFEVLMCFILSQNNTILRIRKMYDVLCSQYGTEVEPFSYAFPSPAELKNVTEEELRALGMGFRAPYLLDAIQKHSILDDIKNHSFSKALELLMTIKGVGPKVGSCILLYGFHRMESFPLDTWMLKVMKTWFPSKDGTFFAPYAALAQQYLFHYARTRGLS